MKNKLVLCALCILRVSTYASDGISAKDLSIQAGQTATLEIALNSIEREYNAFVFDLMLPTGISISKGENFLAIYDQTRAYGTEYNLVVVNPKEDVYRFIGYHNNNTAIEGTTGTFIKVTLKADENISSGTATGILIADPASENGGSSVLGFTGKKDFRTYVFADAKFSLNISDDTGFVNIRTDTDDINGSLYNLNGQRIKHPSKGIYIKNGKTILNK